MSYKKINVDERHAGKRVDVVAGELLPNLSRAYIRRLIDSGEIKVNNMQLKAGAHLKMGDKLETKFDESILEKIDPIDLPIIYEDADILVINKPVGVISHSRGKFWNEPSVASFMRQKTDQEGERAGIVHRLDRATSGVMICAKNQAALSWLQKQFSERKVVKTYVAVISGHLKQAEAMIDMPIERNPNSPATFRVGVNGRPAQTYYKVISLNDNYSELELRPLTGRTHQLRVHLKQLGHPIVGDNLYGGEPAPRLMLHAKSLQIKSMDKKMRLFEAPLPAEFKRLVT